MWTAGVAVVQLLPAGALACYQSLGVNVARTMTDYGACHKAFAFPRPLPQSRPHSHPHKTLVATPSASFRQPYANGPTPKLTRTRIAEPTNCPTGCIATNGIDPIAG